MISKLNEKKPNRAAAIILVSESIMHHRCIMRCIKTRSGARLLCRLVTGAQCPVNNDKDQYSAEASTT